MFQCIYMPPRLEKESMATMYSYVVEFRCSAAQTFSRPREMQISIKNYAIQLSCKFNNFSWCYPPPFRLLRISTNKRSTRKTILSPFWCLWGLGTRLTIYVVVSLYRTYAMVKFCRCVILVVIVVLDLLSWCAHVLFHRTTFICTFSLV